MKQIKVLLSLVLEFRKYALLNIIFNILAVIFGLFSITMVVPFLQILFQPEPIQSLPQKMPDFQFQKDVLLQMFYYIIGQLLRTSTPQAALTFICVLTVLMFLLKNACRYLAMYFLAALRNGVVRNLRYRLFHRLLILPISFYSNEKKGDIISRISADVQDVEWSIVSSIEMLTRDPIALMIYLVALFIISPQLTLFSLLTLPLALWIISVIGKSLKRTSLKVQTKLGELVAIIEETITGLRIIKGFNAIDFIANKFKEENQKFYRLSNRMLRKRDLASPLSEMLGALIIITIIWFGGMLVLSHKSGFQADMFILFILMFSQVIPPAKALTVAYYNMQKGFASYQRLQYIFEAEERIVQAPDALRLNGFSKSIVFQNVSVKYDNSEQPALKNVNITIRKGQFIALVGHSGSGKSTFLDLLPRFYDPTEGQILLDDMNLKQYHIDDLRKLYGIVTQETVLFNDTVRNNIAFGIKDIDDEAIINAAKMAYAHDFIMQLPEGYDTLIGDRGMRLSGGERQRLSIARALLRNPHILLLDEPTSNLDSISENLIYKAIEQLAKEKTIIMAAHRISSIIHADVILVFDNGQIVEQGKHEELIQKRGVYFSLCSIQGIC